MDKFSAALLTALLATAALGQTAPDMVLGTSGGQYNLFTPGEVVSAGGGSSQVVPVPPSAGKFLTEANDGVVTWETLNKVFEEELYQELGAADTGNILNVSTIDDTLERMAIGAIAPNAVVRGGLPAVAGENGKCLAVSDTAATGYAWIDCGGDIPPYFAGSPQSVSFIRASHGDSNTIARGDHRHQFVGAFSTSIPPKSAGDGSAGNSQQIAHGNHQHPAPDSAIPAVTAADNAGYLNVTGSQLDPFKYDLTWRQISQVPSLKADDVPNDGDGAFLFGMNASGTKSFDWLPEHTAVLRGLPAITGHAGNALFVNANATGVEWKAAGGGSGGGGGVSCEWDEIMEFVAPANSFNPASATNFRLVDTSVAAQSAAVIAKMQGDSPYSHFAVSRHSNFVDSNDGAFVLFGAAEVDPGGTDQLVYISGVNPFNINAETWAAAGNLYFGSSAAQLRVVWTGAQTQPANMKFQVWGYSCVASGGGGGGGDTNPTIPKPTVAGKLKHLRVDAAGGAYELADPPTPRTASDSTPENIGSANPGSSVEYSRGDHIHGITAALFSNTNPLPDGTAAPGSTNNAARGDHIHPATSDLPALTGQKGKALIVKSDESGVEWAGRVSPTVLQLVERAAFQASATNKATISWGGGESHPIYRRSGLTRIMPYDLSAINKPTPVVIIINDSNARYELYTTQSQIEALTVAAGGDTAFDQEFIQFEPVNNERPTASWRVGNAGGGRLWIASPSTYTEQDVNIHTNLPIVARFGDYANTPANLTRAAGVWDNSAGTGMLSTADATQLRHWIRGGFINRLFVTAEITRGTGANERLAVSGCELSVGYGVTQADTGRRIYHCESVITGLTTYQIQLIVSEAGNSSGHINLRLQGFNADGNASIAFTLEGRK